MYPTTGYTAPVTIETQARNIFSRLSDVIGQEQARARMTEILAKHGGLTWDFIREFDYITRAAEEMKVKAQNVLDQNNAAEKKIRDNHRIAWMEARYSEWLAGKDVTWAFGRHTAQQIREFKARQASEENDNWREIIKG